MKLIYRTASIVIVALTLQSCLATKNYERPEVIQAENFRSDQLQTDSLSMAQMPWQDLFTDPILVKHISTALENNMDIRIAVENINVAQAYAAQGKAGYLPTLGIGMNYMRSVNSLNTQMGGIIGKRNTVDQFDLTGNLAWEADIWGKITSQKKATVATYLQSVAAHQAVKTQLIVSVATGYFQLLALDAQKEITERTIMNRENSLVTNKALKEAGVVTEVAVKQTEAQLYNAKALLLDLDNNIKLQENYISLLFGEMPMSIERSKLAIQDLNIDLQTGVPAQLLTNRPDVVASEFALVNAFEMTNVAKASFYPTLKITATGGFQAMDFGKLFDPTSLFGNIVGGLAEPILNGRQIRTQHEVRKANQETALLTYKKTILNASKEVSDALYTYQTMSSKISLKEKEAAAYLQAVEFSQELLNNGMASYIEVLTANESALSAQLNVVNTKYAKLAALAQLYRALGGGVH